MKIRLTTLVVLFLFVFCFKSHGQTAMVDSLASKVEQLGNFLLYRNHDSTYIKSYAEYVSLKLLLVSKYNTFGLKDKRHDSSIQYSPGSGYNLGLGLAYKWFSADLAFNLGLGNRYKNDDATFVDFQGKLFSSKQFVEVTLQKYKGYRLRSLSGVLDDIEVPNYRPDIRTINLNLQYLHAFNYDRFSLKAPFILNEVQRKSAGSFIGGVGFTMFVMDADSSVIPSEARSVFDSLIHVTDINLQNLSLSFGYMYTLVFMKNFFVTVGIIPGVGLSSLDYSTSHRYWKSPSLAFRLKSMNAIGYNRSKFFMGAQWLTDFYTERFQDQLTGNIGFGRIKMFVGYRF